MRIQSKRNKRFPKKEGKEEGNCNWKWCKRDETGETNHNIYIPIL